MADQDRDIGLLAGLDQFERFGDRVSPTGFSTMIGILRAMQARPTFTCIWFGTATMAPSGLA